MSESSDVRNDAAREGSALSEGSPDPSILAEPSVDAGLGLKRWQDEEDVDAQLPAEGDTGRADRRARSSRRPARGGSERERRQWRRGGTSVRRWGWQLFAWSLLGMGAGILGATVANALIAGSGGALVGQFVLWVALGVPVVFALARSRPRGLLAFRPVDLLFAVVLGAILRFVQGWLEVRAGGSGAWPVYSSLGGTLPPNWFFEDFVAPVVIAPVVEEFFFRGLVLVALYTAVRRMAGEQIAAFVAVIVSSALFVVAHALLAPVGWDQVVSLALVGIVTSLLVLRTGRIWPAVLVHLVYNGMWVALATVGTLLST